MFPDSAVWEKEIMVSLKRKMLLPEGNDYFLNAFVPDFSIEPHIDFITFSSIPESHINTISDLLKANNFKITSNPYLKEGNFAKKLEFKDKSIAIDISYKMRLKSILPTILIKVHDPNINILTFIENIFTERCINYKIKEIELTFDFYTEDLVLLQDIVNRHLFLKYQNIKLPSENIDEETYYTAQRKSAKGTHTYIKEINGRVVLRLELNLRRAIIKKIGLRLPLDHIDNLDIGKYITFKYIESEKLLKFVKRLQKQRIRQAYDKSNKSGKLLERTIDIWVKSLSSYSLMYYVEQLKNKERGIQNYTRFLKEYGELINKFRKELAGKSFIPIGKKLYHLKS